MTTLSILVIGILAGLLIAFMATATAFITWVAYQTRKEALLSRQAMQRAVNRSTVAIDQIRGEVSLALSSMDANRLHDASLTIQHGVKSLQTTVSALGKLVFNAGISEGSMGLDINPLVGQAGDNFYRDSVSSIPSPPRSSMDPFQEWHRRKQQERDLAAGATTNIPVTSLPDLQQPDGEALSDDHDDDYLDQYVAQTGVGAGTLDDLPGMTEGSDQFPIQRP